MAAEMRQSLGLMSATTLIVGSSIGSGIFRLPSGMGADVGSGGLLLAVWIVAGVVSLFGALTFAEMAAMYPRAGGQYVFLKEAFGERVGFLYGWTFLSVIQTGIIAAVAVAFAGFVAILFPAVASGFAQKLVAVGCILFLTVVNYLGVKYGGVVQNVFTFVKVGAILALIALAFLVAENPQSLASFDAAVPVETSIVGGFGLAMLAAFFAYDGWNQAAFVASEVKDPQRNVPRAMILGVLIVMAVYTLATAAYIRVLPFQDLVATSTLASDVMGALVGPQGRLFITVAIVASTFGTVNAYVLAGPRAYYALAQEGLFYRGMGSLSKRFGTPDFGTIMQAEWACLLVLTGTFEKLVNYATFGIWFFYGLTGVGYFILRRKAAHVPRPYRTWGYPVIPALFVLAAIYIVVNTLLNDTQNALWGLGVIALGMPVLALAVWMDRRRGARATAVDPSPARP